MMKPVVGEHLFDNGRKYRVIDTGTPYVGNVEYPSGGFLIHIWHLEQWVYLDNSPDEETVRACLRALERLAPYQPAG